MDAPNKAGGTPALHEGMTAGLAGPLAGEEGFEPSNGGSKGRCLTTWRLPNGMQNAGCRMQNAKCRMQNFAGTTSGSVGERIQELRWPSSYQGLGHWLKHEP